MTQAEAIPETTAQPCQFYRPCSHPESDHDARRESSGYGFSYDPCRTCAAERQAKETAERAAAVREIDTLAREIARALTGSGEPKQARWTVQPWTQDFDYGAWRSIKRQSDGQVIDLDRRPGTGPRGRLTIRAESPADISEYTRAVGRYPQHSSKDHGE